MAHHTSQSDADLATKALRAARHGGSSYDLIDNTPDAFAAVTRITGLQATTHPQAVGTLDTWAREQETRRFRERLATLDAAPLQPVAVRAIAPYGQAFDSWREHYLAEAFAEPLTGPGGVMVLGVIFGTEPDPYSCLWPTSRRLVAAISGHDSLWLGPDATTAHATATTLAAQVHGTTVEQLAAQLWLMHQWALTTDPADLDEALHTAQQRITSNPTPDLHDVQQLATLTVEKLLA